VPRSADHDARRSDLAAAAWRLVADGRVEAVSLRSVAAEAGVSMGRVQYYFAT
jgi:TetR/AcrR family transcriptional regulator, transcriptional repressor of bet genes